MASPMVHGNASLEIIASAFTPMLLGADPLQARVIQDRLLHQHGHTANLHFLASLTHAHHPAEYNGPREVQDVVFRDPVRPVQGRRCLR